jgi:two-component system, OmpR family, response regulator QseB
MRLLLIEDDNRIAKPIRTELQFQSYVVEHAKDGEHGLELAQRTEYDLILLDLLLPKLDGVSVCNKLRIDGFAHPILMMTALSSTQDKVLGLDAGADDYIVKPFELEELSARIRALLRRGVNKSPPLLTCGELTVDPARCVASIRGEPVSLTPTEYRILTFFLRHPKETFSKESILQRLWLPEEAVGDDLVKSHIKGLRRKLKDAGITQDLIETVYGFGYRLKSDQ